MRILCSALVLAACAEPHPEPRPTAPEPVASEPAEEPPVEAPPPLAAAPEPDACFIKEWLWPERPRHRDPMRAWLRVEPAPFPWQPGRAPPLLQRGDAIAVEIDESTARVERDGDTFDYHFHTWGGLRDIVVARNVAENSAHPEYRYEVDCSSPLPPNLPLPDDGVLVVEGSDGLSEITCHFHGNGPVCREPAYRCRAVSRDGEIEAHCADGVRRCTHADDVDLAPELPGDETIHACGGGEYGSVIHVVAAGGRPLWAAQAEYLGSQRAEVRGRVLVLEGENHLGGYRSRWRWTRGAIRQQGPTHWWDSGI